MDDVFTCIPDVLSFPGKTTSINSFETQAYILGEAVVDAQGNRKYKRVSNHDRGFTSSKRHGMSLLAKSEEAFQEGYDKIAGKEESVEDVIHTNLDKFMMLQKVKSKDPKKYILHGGLPTIARKVFNMYL